VIIEPSNSAAFEYNPAIDYVSPSPELASLRRASSTRGSLCSPERATCLRAHSASERRFATIKPINIVHGMETTSACSCSTSPASGRPSDRSQTPQLRCDGNCQNIDHRYLEIAMEVAEETARICNSPQPIEIDVPLVYSGLSLQTAGELQMWLMVRYNHHGEKHRLIDESITPEVIALDILGNTHSCFYHAIPRSYTTSQVILGRASLAISSPR
jgi:hypothetical protein